MHPGLFAIGLLEEQGHEALYASRVLAIPLPVVQQCCVMSQSLKALFLQLNVAGSVQHVCVGQKWPVCSSLHVVRRRAIRPERGFSHLGIGKCSRDGALCWLQALSLTAGM